MIKKFTFILCVLSFYLFSMEQKNPSNSGKSSNENKHDYSNNKNDRKNESDLIREFISSSEGQQRKNFYKQKINQMKQICGSEKVNFVQDLLYEDTGHAMMANDSLLKILELILGLSEIKENPDRALTILGFNMSSDETVVVVQACLLLSHLPNFLDQDSAFVRLFKSVGRNGFLHFDRGAFYEIKTALKLILEGERILFLGQHIASDNDSKEFDVITISNRFIECKNWDWLTIDVDFWAVKFLRQLRITNHYGGIYEIHSAREIPGPWKHWFIENGIIFLEG